MRAGHAPGHAPEIVWLAPVIVLATMVVALYLVLPDHDVLRYVVGDDPLAFVVGFVFFYLVVAAILDLVVEFWRDYAGRERDSLSDEELYDVLFWTIRGIRTGMEPGCIANKLVERIGGRVEGRTRQCINSAVGALKDAASRDQVLLWEEREMDLVRAEGWMRVAHVSVLAKVNEVR